jgi:hypothetical protein
MRRMTNITIEWLNSQQTKLIKFSTINEQDIQKIWRSPNEKEYNNKELETLEYHYSLPLFCKMIFRFRQEACCTGLFRGCDPNNQTRLMNYFKLSWEQGYALLEFLHWTRYSLGPVDICALEFGKYDEESMTKSSYLEKWKTNEILFFFYILSGKQKEKLITRYNTECVDRYNEMISHKNNDSQ